MAAVAFAPKYWIPLLSGNVTIPKDIHWHAFFATSWVFIYFIQALLINRKRFDIHQMLGYLSILFAVGVLISGFVVSIGLVERALLRNNAGAKPTLLVNLLDLVLFSILYILAVSKRKSGIEHKRLITLAAIVLSNAAIFRIGRFVIGPGFLSILLAIVLTSGVILLFIYLEKKQSGRPNKTLWRIALAIICVHIIRIPLAISPAWSTIADMILGSFT